MASVSEAYLATLANQTFLKPWAITNPFRKTGKELTDLLIPFGEDVVIVSDKACRFNTRADLALAWSRWRRDAIDASVVQLAGAVRQLDRPDCRIFVDHKATEPLAYDVPSSSDRRYHLIAVVRPDHDPQDVPVGWPGLFYSGQPDLAPFQVGPMFVGEHFVHVFDGQTLDLLVGHLSTGPDFIAYLSSRAAALSRRPDITFSEADLLAIATFNWMNGEGFTISLDASERGELNDSPWAAYAQSDRAAATRKESEESKAIDRIIEEFHREYLEGRVRGEGGQDPRRHEEAMRILAAESRFARRMIFGALKSILLEPDQTTFWSATVPSPTHASVRYLWLAYPRRPDSMSEQDQARLAHDHLSQHLIVAADDFPEDTFVGIAVPNRAAHDNLLVMQVMDASKRDPAAAARAAFWRQQGVFRHPAAEHRLHRP